MNEQLTLHIDNEINNLRSILQREIGDIPLPKGGKIFLQSGESKFRSNVFDRIEFINGCFGEQGIPENLQELIVAQVVQQVLEASPPYLNAKNDLLYTRRRDLEHMLTLHFTRDTLLTSQRLEPSHEDLKNEKPSYALNFHGELSYALLHILNKHMLHAPPESFDFLRDIGRTTDTLDQINTQKGTLLGWKKATPYGIDAQLPQRKKAFCETIDARQPRHFLDNVMLDENAPDAPITVAIWNRNASEIRDPNRRFSLDFVKQIVSHAQERIGDRPLRLLILGDKGRLQGLKAWATGLGISYHDHRDEHMLEHESPSGTPYLPKNEQLYRVRHIMKAFNPSLIIGPRAGLIALCSLVGCAGLQIGLGSEQSTKITPRTRRQPHNAPGTGAVHQTDDKRLLQVFARCPTDGIGSYLNVTMDSPNPDKAVVHSSNQDILYLTLSVMMVENPTFKPLLLETLASYLSGNSEALQKLSDLLGAYHMYEASLKSHASVSSEYTKDDHDTGGGSSPDSNKKSGGDRSPDDRNQGGRNSPPDESKSSDQKPTTSHHRGHQRMMHAEPLSYDNNHDSNKEITMNSKLFFEGFKTEIESHQKQYLDFTADDQSNLLIDGVLNLNLDDFKHLYTTIIPAEHRTRLLQHDAFIVFEYALNYPEHLSYLLDALQHDAAVTLLEDGKLVRYALQLAEDNYDKAYKAFNQLKSVGQAKNWSNMLIQHDYLVIRSIAENLGAEDAWNQCAELTEHDKKHALMADNYMMFRRASLSTQRSELIALMSKFLTVQEFQNGINAYSGDVVYHAILAEDQAFFNRYYPMLTEESRDDLAARVLTQAPEESSETFERLQQLAKHQSPPSTPSSRNSIFTTTPSSVAVATLTPSSQDHEAPKGKLSQSDRDYLSRKSSSLFSASDETSPNIKKDSDSEQSQLDSPAI